MAVLFSACWQDSTLIKLRFVMSKNWSLEKFIKIMCGNQIRRALDLQRQAVSAGPPPLCLRAASRRPGRLGEWPSANTT